MKWIIREKKNKSDEFNAGSKARLDVDKIMVSLGYNPVFIEGDIVVTKGIVNKILNHKRTYNQWKNAVKHFKRGDVVFIQLPVFNHTMFIGLLFKLLSKRGVHIIGLVHDLESIRWALKKEVSVLRKIRYGLEETAALKKADYVIVHNRKMMQFIHRKNKISLDKMNGLEIFDYLYAPNRIDRASNINSPIVIAGNLSKEKSGYVYKLPSTIPFNLYGANYDEKTCVDSNVNYLGVFPPDDLPDALNGCFGLVWDGPSSETCEGICGEYLRYNNPHKTSLYLASGLPVIIWDKAALSRFVKKQGVGITVGSLSEIGDKINKLSKEEYKTMVRNTEALGYKLRNGFFLKRSISMIENEINKSVFFLNKQVKQ